MNESKIFYDLCEYLSIVYPELNADQLREAANCGVVAALDIGKDFIEEMEE